LIARVTATEYAVRVDLKCNQGNHYQLSFGGTYYPDSHVKFADVKVSQSESPVLDFMAGKDFGIGMFGNRGSSVVSAGIRFAQFNSKSSVNINGIPDLQYPSAPINSIPELEAFLYATYIFTPTPASRTLSEVFEG
jgi:hypothetical protein